MCIQKIYRLQGFKQVLHDSFINQLANAYSLGHNCEYLCYYIRDHETTILHILGTEILGLFQVDLLSNFRLEMTTEHIPALSGSLYCCFLAIRMCLILKYRIFFEKEKINFVNVIIG